MRDLEIAPEVAALIGADQAARLVSDNWNQPVSCWECDILILANEPAAVLVIRPVDYRTGAVAFIVHAHRRCASSEIRETTVAELTARRAHHDSTDDDDVDAVALVWDCGDGYGYPVVLISFRQELVLAEGSERTDGVTAALLEQGWHLVTDLASPPPVAPIGSRVRYTPAADDTGHALLELINPTDEVETAVAISQADAWEIAVRDVGHTAVMLGSRYLSDWLLDGYVHPTERAAEDGRLTGGMVPVEIQNAEHESVDQVKPTSTPAH